MRSSPSSWLAGPCGRRPRGRLRGQHDQRIDLDVAEPGAVLQEQARQPRSWRAPAPSVSRSGRPRNAPSSGAPRSERIISARRVRRRSATGGSPRPSSPRPRSPPRPTAITGPNWGSSRTPTSISTPSTISCTRKPSTVAARIMRPQPRRHGVGRRAHRRGVGEMQRDAADLGLVARLRRDDLHRHREADLGRLGGRSSGDAASARARQREAVRRQQRLERAGVGLLGGVRRILCGGHRARVAAAAGVAHEVLQARGRSRAGRG